MAYKELHISKRLAILLLAFVLFLPSVVKFSHALTHNHEHEICLEKNKAHFHNVEFDCEFYKFKLSNSFYLKIVRYTVFEDVIPHQLNAVYHPSLKSHQQLSFYLRGPPILA